MAASAGIGAFGTTFTWNLNLVGEPKTINGVPVTTDFIELTNHDSDDGFREWIPGLMDGGEINLDGNFVPADVGQAGLIADQLSKTKRAWKITYPNVAGSTYEGYGYVSKFEVTGPFDGVLSFSSAIKITGKPTFTAAP